MHSLDERCRGDAKDPMLGLGLGLEEIYTDFGFSSPTHLAFAWLSHLARLCQSDMVSKCAFVLKRVVVGSVLCSLNVFRHLSLVVFMDLMHRF